MSRQPRSEIFDADRYIPSADGIEEEEVSEEEERHVQERVERRGEERRESWIDPLLSQSLPREMF